MNAYLVLGPESSGTRMMTRLLMAAAFGGGNVSAGERLWR